jgi:hypothetical protein
VGLTLDARCGGCEFARADLRVGATMAMMSGERRSSFRVFPCLACKDLVSVEVFLGEPLPPHDCALCGARLALAPETELRIVPMSGLALAGHRCPRCQVDRLDFVKKATWT